jgi:hypothetical protein
MTMPADEVDSASTIPQQSTVCHDPYSPFRHSLHRYPLRTCRLRVSQRPFGSGGVWLVMGQIHQKLELTLNGLVSLAMLWDVEVAGVQPAGKYLVAFQVRDHAAAEELLMRSGQAFFFGDELYAAPMMSDPQWMKRELKALQEADPEVRGPNSCVQFELRRSDNKLVKK